MCVVCVCGCRFDTTLTEPFTLSFHQGLSADALLTAPRAAATDGADALLDASAAAAAATDNAGLAAAYVKESAADAAAAAAAADADAFVEAELARRMGLPPPSNPTSAADAWAGARDALYEVPAELRGQRARVGGDAEAYGGGAAVVEVALSAEEAVHNVERTEAAKRTLLGLAPVQRVRAGDADADAARAARAVLPKAFGAAKKGRRG